VLGAFLAMAGFTFLLLVFHYIRLFDSADAVVVERGYGTISNQTNPANPRIKQQENPLYLKFLEFLSMEALNHLKSTNTTADTEVPALSKENIGLKAWRSSKEV
jgi:hypothetical protein